MTGRPPALGQDLVDRLRALASGAQGSPRMVDRMKHRAIRTVGRPLRKVVVRLVDPSLQATLDQLRRETAATALPVASASPPEVEVLRAELASTHAAVVQLRSRLDAVERALTERPPGTGP